jgi:hypothetical protein
LAGKSLNPQNSPIASFFALMPMHAPISVPRLSEAEMREIDYPVMAQAFATHRELGRLCDEGIY